MTESSASAIRLLFRNSCIVNTFWLNVKHSTDATVVLKCKLRDNENINKETKKVTS